MWHGVNYHGCDVIPYQIENVLFLRKIVQELFAFVWLDSLKKVFFSYFREEQVSFVKFELPDVEILKFFPKFQTLNIFETSSIDIFMLRESLQVHEQTLVSSF